MNRLSRKHLGYLLVLVPQLLFVAGMQAGHPWLPVVFFFVVLPILRPVVGNDEAPPDTAPAPLLALYLRILPRLYCGVWALVLPWSASVLASRPMPAVDVLGFALSFWIVASLNTAVAHELIHRRHRLDHTLGRVLASSVGYFHLAEEHTAHHLRCGHYHDSDAARPGTSLYRFALTRCRRSLVDAWKVEDGRCKRRHLPWRSNRLLHSATLPVLIGAGFFLAAGVTGLYFYALQVIATAFSVQAITYLQHWGLTEKETPELADYGFTWDDRCWMQACVTLNHAYHSRHHLCPGLPYYALAPSQNGPELAASYPVMFAIALFPRWFDSIMASRLAAWRERHARREEQAHGHDCLGALRQSKAGPKRARRP